MKAVILNGPGQLTVGEVPAPALKPGQSLVRITHAGICGTDQKIFSGGIPVNYPLIMGHEMIGVVEDAPHGGPVAGSRVIVDPVTYCGVCYQCQAGQTNLCPGGPLIGRDIDGGFAEFVAAPAANLYPLPDGVGDLAATGIQVLTTCLHAARQAPAFAGENVAVIGLGVTGLLHVQLAKAQGAGTVIGITRSAWKRQLAESLGADATAEPGEKAKQLVLEMTEGRGADLVIETAGAVSALAEAIDLARIGGRLLPFGIYTATDGHLPFYQLYFKELAILNARAAKGEDYPASIKLVERGAVKLEPLISHVLPMDELEHAIAMLSASSERPMKIILER